MSDTPAERKPINWSELFAFTAVFRSFRMAIDWKKLTLAFLGIFITYVAGRTLDAVWSTKGSPVVLSGGVSELTVFTMEGGEGRDAAMKMIRDAAKDSAAKRVGVFELLLGYTRERVNLAVDAILHLSPGMLLTTLIGGVLAIIWMITMHPFYALIFLSISILLWALCGGAICRVAAMQATRDERIGLSEAMQFSYAKLTDFLIAPVFPFGILALFGALLFVAGIFGMIPWLGDLLVGLFFPLAIMIGMAMAALFIGAIVGSSLFYPTIAVENSDAFDAFSRSIQYVYSRPWKTSLYMIAAMAYGAICLLFVKLFVRVTLWLVFACVGFSMNWSTPSANTDSPPPKEMGKLEAMWHAPSLSYENQFVGNARTHELSGASWLAQFLIKCWIYMLWAGVAAFVVSFFYCASTIIYLLLRQEVDATDFEEVYLEEIPMDGTTARAPVGGGAAPEMQGGGGTSLPVISP